MKLFPLLFLLFFIFMTKFKDKSISASEDQDQENETGNCDKYRDCNIVKRMTTVGAMRHSFR